MSWTIVTWLGEGEETKINVNLEEGKFDELCQAFFTCWQKGRLKTRGVHGVLEVFRNIFSSKSTHD